MDVARLVTRDASPAGAFLATVDKRALGCNLFILRNISRAPLIQEQTLRSSVECAGVGLHSGAPVRLRIAPAPSGTGIVFRRVDLDEFEIEATGRNVARVSYATSL